LTTLSIDWIKPAKVALFVACLLPLGWLIDLAVQDELGPNPVETLTRSLGDWALRLLLVTLAVTPLRRLMGWSALVRFRRLLGVFAFFYALLHLTSYLVLDKTLDGFEIWEDLFKRPYITVGMTVFLLLVPLAATSTNAAIRWLGGRRWRTLHQLVYPAALGAVVHFYLMVKADVREPLLYAAILALLLVTRLPWFPWSRVAMASTRVTQARAERY
jgi:methionine sulfoxide reductase heme-binding subunit